MADDDDFARTVAVDWGGDEQNPVEVAPAGTPAAFNAPAQAFAPAVDQEEKFASTMALPEGMSLEDLDAQLGNLGGGGGGGGKPMDPNLAAALAPTEALHAGPPPAVHVPAGPAHSRGPVDVNSDPFLEKFKNLPAPPPSSVAKPASSANFWLIVVGVTLAVLGIGGVLVLFLL